MDIRDYQRKAFKTNVVIDPDIYLLGLVGEVGSVFSAYKKIERDPNNDRAARRELSEEVGDVLWYLAAVASSLDINLEKAAEFNLEKTRNYFISKSRKYFDSKFPKSQQLPRKMVVQFKPAGSGQVRISIDGATIGDKLDDNVMTPDGYGAASNDQLKTAVYMTSPMRSLLRAEKCGGRSTFNQPVEFGSH